MAFHSYRAFWHLLHFFGGIKMNSTSNKSEKIAEGLRQSFKKNPILKWPTVFAMVITPYQTESLLPMK